MHNQARFYHSALKVATGLQPAKFEDRSFVQTMKSVCSSLLSAVSASACREALEQALKIEILLMEPTEKGMFSESGLSAVRCVCTTNLAYVTFAMHQPAMAL